MKSFIVSLAMLLSFAISTNKLAGRWQKISPAGNVTGIVFKEDNTFEAYINKKPFVTGKWSLKDSIFQLTDNGCNGANGTYKLSFFSNDDSIKLELIHDPCAERGKGMHQSKYGRVK